MLLFTCSVSCMLDALYNRATNKFQHSLLCGSIDSWTKSSVTVCMVCVCVRSWVYALPLEHCTVLVISYLSQKNSTTGETPSGLCSNF
jgi:hypothetical protein